MRSPSPFRGGYSSTACALGEKPPALARSKETPPPLRGPPPLSGEAASKAPLKGELSPKVTEGLFVLCPQLGQDLLVAGLPAGDPVKVTAGGFADRHTLSGKGSADVAEIAFALRSRNIFHGNKFSHINNSSYNLNADLACQVASWSQVGSMFASSLYQVVRHHPETLEQFLNMA